MAVTVWSVWAVGIVSVGAAAALPMPQEARSAQCVFEGTARNRVTQAGLSQVTIHLIAADTTAGYAGSSGAGGVFRFDGVAPGDYRVEAERAGFTAQWVLADRDGHTLSGIHLEPGQSVTAAALWFTPEGSISGKVAAADGEPLPGASVTLMERKWQHGQRVYSNVEGVSTDDSGAYRFDSVEAGRYWIYCARPRMGPLSATILEAPGKPEMRLAGRYYPNAPQLDAASPVELGAGQDILGIDFKLPLAPVFHVTGTYSGAGEDIGVDLKARHGDGMLDAGEGGYVKDGKFDIAAVTPGAYYLYSFESSPSEYRASAKIPLTLSAEGMAGIVAPPLAPPAQSGLKGRVRVDGDPAPGKIPVQISYQGAEEADYAWLQRRAEPHADGTFEFTGLAADRYTIRIANLDTGKEGGFYLKSVRVNGVDAPGHEVDLTGGPAENVELVLSAEVAGIEGTVLPSDEAGEITVVMVPEKTAPGATAPVEAFLDPSRHFQATDLEPGTYRVFAVVGYDRGLWQNTEFLRQIAGRGVRVEVAARAAAKIELRTLSAADVRQVEERIE